MNAPAQPTDDLPVQPGQILAGKYRVDRVLGRGGMGVVVEARHVTLDERVALKFLLPDYAQHPEASARFHREAKAAIKIKGEHVARVTDVGTLDTGSPYMVMEFLEGTDLSKALERYGVCQIPDAIDYLLQACEAIAEAHGHGIVHRDLKPANLFLTRRPDGTPMIKVLDFGISKMSGSGVDNLTRTTASMGSALYMSPEQMQTTRGVDHRTDIYALGISLYELLAGKQPFYADTLPQLCAEVLTGYPTPIRQLRAEVPDALAAVLEKAYARDRDQRYQTIAELCAALAPWAPARSQNTLDRIARMAGVAPTMAGAPPRAMSSAGVSGSNPSLAILGSMPGASQSGNYPAQTGGYPTGQTGNYQQGLPGAQTGNQVGAQTGNPAFGAQTGNPAVGAQTGNQAVGAQTANPQQTGGQVSPHHHDPLSIGGYQGPMSTKAAAAFAAGGSTDAAFSRTGNLGGSSGKTGLFVVIAILAVALIGLGMAFLFLRDHHEIPPQSALPGVTEVASPQPPPTTPVTAPATTTTPDPTAAPTTTATAPDPTATASAPKPKTAPKGIIKPAGAMTSR